MAENTDGRSWLDLHEATSAEPSAVVLLLHGSGPNERDAMAPLAQELSRLGATVIVPDWDRTTIGLEGRLAGSAAVAALTATRLGCERVIVVGWSAGGSAAHWLSALDGSPFTGLGLIGSSLEPLPGLPPVGSRPVPTVVVAGSADLLVTAADTERAAAVLRDRGHTVRTVTVDADHAGLIGTEYDDALRRCRPSARVEVIEAGRATASAVLGA